ncbi:MAG: hypothetical protein COA58_11690 [Bacteroidetes bacterium]|nr:MAG: hypothetical protein COA58_11690 [Bacteroidota bacterium]
MKIQFSLVVLLILGLAACSSHEYEKQKGISLEQTNENVNSNELENNQQFKDLQTRPGKVLYTGHKEHRLVSIFKLNYSPKTKKYFTGSNAYHTIYSYNEYTGNHYTNFMPGLEATYGYNMLNISHYNRDSNENNLFFEKPVLINNLYYPSESQDSLNNQPITRDYYLVSVYDEDSNNDSLINHKDLRRLYHFDIDGKNKSLLIPKKYSVMGSQYDTNNDHMLIRARLDKNENGSIDENDAIHIFWIDLKKPKEGVRLY